jgi:iron complex transport system permease protein
MKVLVTLLLLILAVLVLLALELASGPAGISFLQGIRDAMAGTESVASIIVLEIRLPRGILAILTGASLALAGTALQGLLRNPLASPDILGVSQTAGLFAVLTIYFGLAALHWLLLPAAAIIGAALSVSLMLHLSRRFAGTGTIILCGIAISATAGSLIALLLNLAPNPLALQEIYYWMLGSVSNRSMREVWTALPFMLAAIIVLLRQRHFLDALTLGEHTTQSLGFDISKCTLAVIAGAAGCTGAAVAVSGNIGFIGLVVPHILRPLAGHEPGKLMILSIPGGAVLVLLADVLVQHLPGTQELQLGVLTAALGGPFFLYLLLRQKVSIR